MQDYFTRPKTLSLFVARLAAFFTALFAALILSGCGQKGPLYFPEKEISTVQQQVPATDDENDEHEKKPSASQ